MHAVMELLRELFANIDKDYISDCLFLDYSKAFNAVDHKILLGITEILRF